MGHFYVLLGLGVLALLAFLLSVARRLGRRQRLPYVLDQALFSPAERAFLPVLERALGKGFRVYGKVRAADILGIRPRTGRQARRRALGRLGSHRFDFLVCTAESSAIACAVNLSPRSRLGRRPPHNGLDRICAAAGLPLVRFREGDRYSVVEIEDLVFAAMHSVRLRPKEPEPPREETLAALNDLSAAIATDGGAGSSRRGTRALPTTRPGQPVGATRRDSGSTSARSQRAEPVMTPSLPADSAVDEGPRFRIEGDLDLDERPVRINRS